MKSFLILSVVYLFACVNCYENNNFTILINKNATNITKLDIQQRLEHIRNLVSLYYLPTIVIIGLIGNTLTIIILSKEKSLLRLHDSSKSLRDNFEKFSSQYNSVNHINQFHSKNSIKSQTQINLQTRRKTFTPKKATNQFSSSNYFIFCLAFSDLMYNFVLLLVWISRIGYNLVHLKYICQLTIAITYICSFLSAAFTTLFTFQRFMAVLRPLKSATNFSLQSPCFIKRLILGLCVFSLLVYSYSLFLYDTEPKKDHENTEAFSKCGPKDHRKNLLLIIDNTVDTLLTLIIPSFGIIFMNVAICRSFSNYQKESLFKEKDKLIGMKKSKSVRSTFSNYDEAILYQETSLNEDDTMRRSSLTSNIIEIEPNEFKILSTKNSTTYLGLPLKPESKTIISSNEMPHKASHQTTSSRHVTKTLLIVSFAFIFLNSPFRASQLFSFVRMFISKNYVYSNFEFAINEVLLNLYFTSYSVNFFLYSLCGRKFRDSLKALVYFCVFFFYTKISRLLRYLFLAITRKK